MSTHPARCRAVFIATLVDVAGGYPGWTICSLTTTTADLFVRYLRLIRCRAPHCGTLMLRTGRAMVMQIDIYGDGGAELAATATVNFAIINGATPTSGLRADDKARIPGYSKMVTSLPQPTIQFARRLPCRSRELSFPGVRRRQPPVRTAGSADQFLPDKRKNVIDYVQVRGRTKIVVRGHISEYMIPNPTFEKVAKPGAQEDYFPQRRAGARPTARSSASP